MKLNPETAPQRRKLLRRSLIGLTGLAVVLLSVVGYLYYQYSQALKPLNSDAAEITVTVDLDSGVAEIAENLEINHVIRKASAFEWYVRLSRVGSLQAGTYRLKASMGVPEIVGILETGKVATDYVTIFPSKRLDQLQASLVKAGFVEAEVVAALDPAQYASHPLFTETTLPDSLEGYIYPETFQKDAATTPIQIITASLDELDKLITEELKAQLAAQGLTLRQAFILASIVEQEAGEPKDGEDDPRPIVAQVFLKRMRIGMMLGSDVTAFYESRKLGLDDSVQYDSPYNTRVYGGLPPGPISNFSAAALTAVAQPANTDWLYFVASDPEDGKTYFSKTNEEHERLVEQHCKTLCN